MDDLSTSKSLSDNDTNHFLTDMNTLGKNMISMFDTTYQNIIKLCTTEHTHTIK